MIHADEVPLAVVGVDSQARSPGALESLVDFGNFEVPFLGWGEGGHESVNRGLPCPESQVVRRDGSC